MLKVIKPGVLSCVQDLGRHGRRALGVSQSGALDPIAVKLNHRLLGNQQSASIIEITIGLAEFEFTTPCSFAITGGHLQAKLNNRPIYAGWRHYAKAGDRVSFATHKSAQRAYLGVQGGFNVPNIMGSCATDIQGQFGGLHGRALQVNDTLTYQTHSFKPLLGVKQPTYTNCIRLLPGPHCDLISKQCFNTLIQQAWRLDDKSNRMGARLKAHPSLIHNQTINTQAVHPGVVQLPPNGAPIVLLNDCQTTGGYPIIAKVIEADLRHFSQLGAGHSIYFESVDLAQAKHAYIELEIHCAQFDIALNAQ